MQADSQQPHEIDLTSIQQALRAPLDFIENPDRRAEIERYIANVEVFAERALYDVIAEVVAAINAAAGAQRVRLEYHGRKLAVVVEQSAAEPDLEPDFTANIEGDFEKVTIRLPSELKDLISQAASGRGLSLNSWYIRELARAISREARNAFTDTGPRGPWDSQGTRPPREPRDPGSGRMRGYVGD